MVEPAAIGQVIRRLREDRGWTYRDVAERIGKNPSSIGRKERGELSVKRPEQKRLAEVFGIPVEEFDRLVHEVDQAMPVSDVVGVPRDVARSKKSHANILIDEINTRIRDLTLDQIAEVYSSVKRFQAITLSRQLDIKPRDPQAISKLRRADGPEDGAEDPPTRTRRTQI